VVPPERMTFPILLIGTEQNKSIKLCKNENVK